MANVVRLGVDRITRRQLEAAKQALERGLNTVRIPEPLRCSVWANTHFYLSPESSALEGPWRCAPFQVDILDCFGNDDIRIIDFEKCARIGYTKMLMVFAGYMLEHKRRSGAMFQPTDGDAAEFKKTEVDPMVRDVAVLRNAFKGVDIEKRSKFNTVDLVQFVNANLFVRGGKSGRNYRRLTIDWINYDELEGFEREVGDEGGATTLGDIRVTNSPFPKSIRGSTPRRDTGSLLKAEVELAALKFQRFWHCPSCGTAQTLEWGQMRWESGKPETAHYECGECGEHWFYADAATLDAGGFWGARVKRDDSLVLTHRIDDGYLRDSTDQVVEWPRHIAFHMWSAYSPWFAWDELVAEWLEANAKLKTGDNRSLITFTNTRLAQYWQDEEIEVEYDAIYERAQKTKYTRPPKRAHVLTVAVDIQGNRLELELVAWGRGFESWGVEYKVIYGDPEELAVWQELETFINDTYETEDGRRLPVAAVALDTGYLPDTAYNFHRRTAHPRVYCLKGIANKPNEHHPISTAPHDRKSGLSSTPVPLFLMGADTCKSIVLKRLALEGLSLIHI